MSCRRIATISAVAGSAAWLSYFAVSVKNPFDHGWAAVLLLLAPLVLVPLIECIVEARFCDGPERSLLRIAALVQPFAALALAGSFLLPVGSYAAAAAAPWLAATCLFALLGLLRLWRRGFAPPTELCLNVGLLLFPVGGGWTLLARLGARPLNFDAIIVLLTGVHFHYAALVLPVLIACAGGRGGAAANAAAAFTIVGVPAVATGITTTKLGLTPAIEVFAAWTMAAGGFLAAWLHLRRASERQRPAVQRAAFYVVAACLAFAMTFAALYGGRHIYRIRWLDIPWMRVLHGTTIAFGVGLAGISAWAFDRSTDPKERRDA